MPIRHVALFTCFSVLSIASLLAACTLGPMPVPLDQTLAVLWSGIWPFSTGVVGDDTIRTVILDIRLSRVLLSFLVGSGLAVCGAAFQGVLRNPLADPFTLGVSSGAAFGASLAMSLGMAGSTAVFGMTGLPVAGLAGALAALFAVMALARSAGGFRRETLVLSGIVVATFLAALIALVKALDEDAVGAIVFWIMGSFQGRGFMHVWLYLPYGIVGTAILLFYSRELDMLSLGDIQAEQLGVAAKRTRLIVLTAGSLMAGAAVAVSGVIGFVGLVVPHLVRRMVGASHPRLLMASAFAGGLLLLWSDVIARLILPGGEELPVGVVTALVGGPFFCLVLRQSRREHA
ncbi:FecCD family ABC transporter permease [Desulfovibrio inopinatus]|uniref:FecCD family ABC transporter permease n=1 Tax=Desulfovibrio inopinatus TaxID=102109 RepID=UPI000684F30F|nr:iron ABC transporter permease [Desulfovibrio inopinatus]